MPIEIRRIVFTHNESTRAIHDYGKKFNMSFPEGKVVKAEISGRTDYEFQTAKQFRTIVGKNDVQKDNNNSTIIITFYDEQTMERRFYNLTSQFLTMALVEYCMNNGIILPKNAQKKADMAEMNLCLDVEVDSKTADTPSQLTLEDN
jgi:hypothetical protein